MKKTSLRQNNTKKQPVKSVDKLADRDPIPATFSSIEEVATFWDSHDSGDYKDCFGEEVKFEISPTAKTVQLNYELARNSSTTSSNLASG